MVEITSWYPSKTCTAKVVEQQLQSAIVLCAQVLTVKEEGKIAAAADRTSVAAPQGVGSAFTVIREELAEINTHRDGRTVSSFSELTTKKLGLEGSCLLHLNKALR
jgi:hypothetical protein